MPRLRRLLATAVCTAAVSVGLNAVLAGALAAPGVDGQAGYRNGLVCAHAGVSTALRAWTVADSDQPGFVLGDLPDGGAPATDPAAERVALDPATGPLSAADLATAARLMSTVGASTRPADRVAVAEVAATVAALGGTAPRAVGCLQDGVAGLDAAEAQAQWEQAGQLAGPYRVTLSAGVARLTLTERADLIATVRAASGAPVPGLAVRFAAPGATVPRAGAVTGADGTASVPISVPAGSTATSIRASATVTASVGLILASETGKTPIVYPDAPQTFTGTTTIPIRTTAQPAAVPAVDRHLLLSGGQVRGSVSVSGMSGHDGTVNLTLLGPLAVPASGTCAALTDQDWKDALTGQMATPVATTTVPVVGGAPATAPALVAQPAAPGCYSLAATVSTSNARPNVTRTFGYASAAQTLLVLPYTVSSSADHHGVAGAGPLSVTVRLEPVSGAAPALAAAAETTTGADPSAPATGGAGSGPAGTDGPDPTAAAARTDGPDPVAAPGAEQPRLPVALAGLTGRVYGPRYAPFGVCPHTGWAGRAVVSPLTAIGTAGDTVTMRSRPLSGSDCYSYRVAGRVDAGNLGSVAFDFGPDRPEAATLLLHPSVQVEYPGRGWQGLPIGSASVATVSVHGSLSQPGTLTLRLARPAAGALGCYDGGWGDAVLLPVSGPTIHTTGDGSYRVPSPKLPANACYSLVPVFTTTANPAVRVSGAAGDTSSIVAADPPAPRALPVDVSRAAPDPYARLRTQLTALAVLVLLSTASVGTFVAARRAGRRLAALPDEPRWLL